MKALVLIPPPYHDGKGIPSIEEFLAIVNMHKPICAIYSSPIHLDFAKLIANKNGIIFVHRNTNLGDEDVISQDDENALINVAGHPTGSVDLSHKMWSALELAKWTHFHEHQTVILIADSAIVKSYLYEIRAETKIADHGHLVLSYFRYGDTPEIVLE